MRRFGLLALCCVPVMAGCRAAAVGRDYWWEVPCKEGPPTTTAPLGLFPRHPRLMFRPADSVGLGRSYEQIRELYRRDTTFRTVFDKALLIDPGRQDPAMLAACWIITGEDRFAEAAVGRMLNERLGRSGEPYYSNIYIHALAYDWLFHHPAFTAERKKVVVDKIIERLKTELADLDDHGMALWHGRNQAANGTMIAALAIGDLPGGARLLRRAAGHYVESLRALQYSEGWPEGASYWIYNRAGPYAMAADCVMTALGTDVLDGVPIRQVMRTIGYWQLYQHGPNGVFEPYGDSAGSLQLGQTGWWELTTDHYARLSRDAGLMAGADYLRNRSPDPYGRRPYYWRVLYTYDPSCRPGGQDYDPARPELWMRRHLPQAMLFGRHSYGVAFFRGDWGDPDETYATFKAGDMLAHHDHYDTGSFGIQRGGDLARRTGRYGFYTGAHRLGYFVQTVSANSLLILAPGEFCGYLREKYPASWQWLSGGQRVIRPTSFNCVSLEHYRRQLNDGPHLERGDITAFVSEPGRFDYVAADMTAAYNSTRWAEPGQVPKVSLVTRQFLYLRPEQTFIVFDRVETTRPNFIPKFLLHGCSKPKSASERVLARRLPPTTQHDAESGVFETTDRVLVTEHGRGRLTQRILLPERSRTLKIGGPEFCFYVQADGDQSHGFTGPNLSIGAGRRPDSRAWTDQWRVEVEPAEPAVSVRFLNVLLPRLAADDSPLPEVERVEAGSQADAVRVGRTVVVFSRSGRAVTEVRLDTATPVDCLVLDAKPGAVYDAGAKSVRADAEGVLRVDGLAGGGGLLKSR